MMTPEAKEKKLCESLSSFGAVVVAFSGGVDSSYLAYMAHRVLGAKARSVTAISPAVSVFQRRLALDFAHRHGLNHTLVETSEMDDPSYTRNPSNRCYFCKSELYDRLEQLRRQWKAEVVMDGSNRDDREDWRPGRRAAGERKVLSPLMEADLGKEELRALSRKWGLETWDLPAMPCLSSRFPYGVTITPEKLDQVERAEEFLRGLGFLNFRVRHHENLARIEVAVDELPAILKPGVFEAIDRHLRDLGYQFVTLDMGGFRSGSLNRVLELKTD